MTWGEDFARDNFHLSKPSYKRSETSGRGWDIKKFVPVFAYMTQEFRGQIELDR